MACPCNSTPCSCPVPDECAGATPCGQTVDPVTGQAVPAPGVCAPGPGNVPITDAQYQASLGVCLQDAVDQARRVNHTLGLRPYRVFIVWRRRNARQRFETFKEIELTPVQVSPFTGVERNLTVVGINPEGQVVLTEISPAQVTHDDLVGKLDGADLQHNEEFFYEIQQIARCVGQKPIRAGRYTPMTVPYFDGENYQWTLILTDQNNERAPVDNPDVPDRDETFRPATRPRRKPSLRT